MVLNIRNPEADALARKLAVAEKTTVTEAVINALRAKLKKHGAGEASKVSTEILLKRHGLSFPKNRKPIPQSAYHDLDHSDIYED
jgi:antitoxin VapB